MRELISVTIFILFQLHSSGQSSLASRTESNVSIELSIAHDEGLKSLNNCVSFDNEVFIILRNNTDSILRVYENWNSYGYYNFSFEIKTNDSLYLVTRPKKEWYRNFPTHHALLPNECIVFQVDLIDTTCANSRFYRGIYEDGWIGLPSKMDTALIRVIYSVPEEFNSYSERAIRKEEFLEDIQYMDSIDLEIYNEIISPKENENPEARTWIYSDRTVSEWKKIIIMN